MRACLQVLEETGLDLQLDKIQYAYSVNSVFTSGAHYVTVFCRAEVPPAAIPQNLEPHKCEGWQWVSECVQGGVEGAAMLPVVCRSGYVNSTLGVEGQPACQVGCSCCCAASLWQDWLEGGCLLSVPAVSAAPPPPSSCTSCTHIPPPLAG